MTGFVVGEDALLLLRDDPALLQACNDALHRGIEVLGLISWASRPPGAIAASFAMFARSAPVSPAVWRATTCRSTSAASGCPVWTPRISSRPTRSGAGRAPGDRSGRAEECRVEILEAVRGAHHDDPIVGREAVQLDEQLIQRLILLAVEPVPGARGADGVELVDEDDRRRVSLPRLGEELPDTGRAEAANISTNADALWEKNDAPDSCATALASSVFPFRGGP